MARGEQLGEAEEPDNFEEIVEHEVQRRMNEDKDEEKPLFKIPFKRKKKESVPTSTEVVGETLSKEDAEEEEYVQKAKEQLPGLADKIHRMDKFKPVEEPEVTKEEPEVTKEVSKKKPQNKVRGWHFMNEFVDDNHDVYQKGKFIGNDPSKTPTSKKA